MEITFILPPCLKTKEDLRNIDPEREALFLFDNYSIYQGYSNGEVEIDADDYKGWFSIFKKNEIHSVEKPYDRLVCWKYIDENKEELNEMKID